MKDIKRDFESFVNDTAISTSAGILQEVQKRITAQTPRLKSVIAKLAVIHLFASAISLTMCPQFGVNFITTGHGLMHYFMQISETYCYILCGAFYLALTFLLARFILSFDEWLVIKRSRAMTILSLSLVSLGAFYLHTPQIHWQIALLWLFGASLGAELVSLSKTEWRRLPQMIFTRRRGSRHL